ncbi:hypothetical protein I547_5566 [Mycobacterium kansasii 824]|nr:hypothetical protein I547_5566 [Mycobacterium kansasii 824]
MGAVRWGRPAAVPHSDRPAAPQACWWFRWRRRWCGRGRRRGGRGGATAVVVAGAGTGSGSALEVAGSAMVSAPTLLTVAIASVAHSPLRRLVLEST